jgi:hypothetical protein
MDLEAASPAGTGHGDPRGPLRLAFDGGRPLDVGLARHRLTQGSKLPPVVPTTFHAIGLLPPIAA